MRRPEADAVARLRAARPSGRSLLHRYRLELAWFGFVVANYLAMFAWPSWETVPFYLVWISLTLLYGLKVWPLRPTLFVLAAVIALTAVPIVTQVMHGTQPVEKAVRVPLMALLFGAVVWHARRRVEAVRIAERRTEQLRAMLERQERFMNDASHELRTPVTIARGHLELAAENAGTSSELEVALDELSRIDAIIGRLLVLAAAGQPDFLRLEYVDLEPFLEDIFMRWSDVAPRAWRLGSLTPGSLRVDPDRLRAALDALLENAVKYSREHDVIELRARTDGRDGIVIEVTDEGRGVRPDALERIFDRFARADAARTRSDGGVGLGLAIVDAIAKRHGGRCTVTSTTRGSTFGLELPGFTPVGSPSGRAGAEEFEDLSVDPAGIPSAPRDQRRRGDHSALHA